MSYMVHLDTGLTNTYPDMLTCLANLTNNCHAYVAGQYTYTRSNAVVNTPNIAGQILCLARQLTNFFVDGSPGTRFILDNTCATDFVGSIMDFMDLDGSANFAIRGLEIETKRRLPAQSNFNFVVFTTCAVTNGLIENVHAQADWYNQSNAPIAHSEAFLVNVSSNSHNLIVRNCQWGILCPVVTYSVQGFLPGSSALLFDITHGNYGDSLIENCVMYGIEDGLITGGPDSGNGNEPQFINFRCRYPGGLRAWYLNPYSGNDFTNAVVWFNEEENLSYYLSGTDPIFLGYDQYANLDAINVVPTNSTSVFAPSTVGDGIPDWWRRAYFGAVTPTNSCSCATCDADGTGQNNLFKFVAGLDPTNPASAFRLTITLVGPSATRLTFGPVLTDVCQFLGQQTCFGDMYWLYTVECSTNLMDWVCTPITTSPCITNGNIVSVTDTQAVDPQKFYRIGICLPSP